MNVVLSGLNQDVLLVYLDDIIIHSGDLPSHLRSIERFLERMRLAILKLKVSKCRMLQREVHYLGHVVSDFATLTAPLHSLTRKGQRFL